jgi:hypothetical protein
MSNYIISNEDAPMREFQERFSFLKDADWIKDKRSLIESVSKASGSSFFFIYLNLDREFVDEFVLIIREKAPHSKIIYVIANGKLQDQKSHQMTPVGGDAYVPFQVDFQSLNSILTGLEPTIINKYGNQLENYKNGQIDISGRSELLNLKKHPLNKEIEQIFSEIFVEKKKKPAWQSLSSLASEKQSEEIELGDKMSDKDQDLPLDDLGELEISDEGDQQASGLEDPGLDLSLEGNIEIDLSSAPDDISEESLDNESGSELELDESLSLSEDSDISIDEPGELPDETKDISLGDDSLDLNIGSSDLEDSSLDFSDDLSVNLKESTETNIVKLDNDDSLSFNEDISSLGDDSPDSESDLSLSDATILNIDLSDDAKEKLKEIDEIMDHDASEVGIKLSEEDVLGGDSSDLDFSNLGSEEPLQEVQDSDIDQPLVSDDLDLESLDFSMEDETRVAVPLKEEKSKKKVKESKEAVELRPTKVDQEFAAPQEKKVMNSRYEGDLGKELKELSGAYSGEMERMQATISNLRLDREELLQKIQKYDEERIFQNRQALTMRAELDEKKIELSIIRKKLNDEITDLKDRMKLFEEKKLILEEKNKILQGELEKSAQKNKIDVKKVQMREKELEQKLELLKADSETQIRHRDMKILDLKRKLDGMEFDMESISVQEKRSVESRFELEDKLEKAIKTLRSAITVLEDESEKSNALEALKKNIDM